MLFTQKNTVIGHFSSSNSASKCPFSSMSHYVHGLSIPRKSASLFLG